MDLAASKPRRRGRPPTYSPAKKISEEIHLSMSPDIWSALHEYAETTEAASLSMAARQILKERLKELGYLKDPVAILPSKKNPF